jgi:broad specificity phosphatase PhoE
MLRDMQHPRRLAVALALLVPVALLARAGAAQSVPDPAAPAGVTHLYCSEYERTAATLAPLAEATGLALEARALELRYGD